MVAWVNRFIIILHQMNRILIQITILLALVCTLIAEQQPYKKVIHNTDPKAKCLDGSSPAVYFHQRQEKNKFLIYFQGGGYCEGNNMPEVIQSCYARSKTEFGSSKNIPAQLKAEGYLSTDPKLNKFAGWTKIFILYCDGALHQGSSDHQIQYKDRELFFRGADNVRSHLKWLTTKYGLADAEKVLLTGSSAGGAATFLWSNYVRSLLVNPQALFSVVDSGVIMNAPSPNTGMFIFATRLQNLYKVANVNQKTPISICNRFFVGEEYKCLLLQYSFTSIEGTMLLINSQYDSQAIKKVIEIDCLKDGKQAKTLSQCTPNQISNIEVYRRIYLNFLSQFLQFSKNGVWTISCSTHVYAIYNSLYNVDSQKVPQATGQTVKSAIERYVLNNQRVTSVDQLPWPSNTACAN